jgi:hypothetical protein
VSAKTVRNQLYSPPVELEFVKVRMPSCTLTLADR